MSDNQNQGLENSFDPKEIKRNNEAILKGKHDETQGVASSETGDQFTAGNHTPEIATNDGSIIETLDTAFHGEPGWSEGENISGSSRADYYEARSYGKSDSEEELDELRERNRKGPDDDGKETSSLFANE